MSARGRAATQRGAAAEREAATWIANETGWPVRRMLGAGRKDDVGDLHGVPDCTVQVVSRTNTTDLAQAIRTKPWQCEQQQANAGTRYGVTLARIVPGLWLAVMTPDQYQEWGAWLFAWRHGDLRVTLGPDWLDAHREATT